LARKGNLVRPTPTQVRILVGTTSIALVAVGLWFSFPAPRLLFLNASVVVRYPVRSTVGLLTTAAGVVLLRSALGLRALRILLAFFGGFLVVFAADRYFFRLEAGPLDLTQDGVFGRTRIPWAEVRRVEPGTSIVVLWGRGDAQIRVSTDSFTENERAILDRTIARHVREARPVR
jgi:hypothetical protein